MDNPVPNRRRMSPEARRDHILDAAAQVVVDEGLAGASMERVAKEAGVSKPLVYNYFENRSNLLITLLLREYPAFQGTPVVPVPNETFEDLIRRTSIDFIDRYVANGVLIQRLMNEPTVAAEVGKRQEAGRRQVTAFFGKRMEAEFGVLEGAGEQAVELAMGITLAAARMLVRDDSDHDHMIDMAVQMIVGAAERLGSHSSRSTASTS